MGIPFHVATRFRLVAMICAVGLGASPALRADAALDAFNQANRLYETGDFKSAAETYEKLLESGRCSDAIEFNLGNALFKSGQVGRAIYHYQRAAWLAPRDPDVRANLTFARRSVDPAYQSRDGWLSRGLHRASLNEWAMIAAVMWWLWLAQLAAGEWKPDLKRALRGYRTLAGLCAAVVSICLGWMAYERLHPGVAIVVVPETSVHYGPLEESREHYKVRDGAELTILGRKDDWLQVEDTAQRIGWLPKAEVLEPAL